MGSSDGVAGHCPRSRRAGTRQRQGERGGLEQAGAGNWEGRPRGGQRWWSAPGRSRLLAQSGAHTRLAGHGATRPSAETAAGTGDSDAKAITAAALAAARVALPGALRLRP